MLAVDAAARDAIKREKETGQIGQWIASVCLTPEVVSELIERGKKADRFRIDHYIIALARARSPEAKEFFSMILQGNTGEFRGYSRAVDPNMDNRFGHSEKFHSAVGLAQLGDESGFEWLIANSGSRPSFAPWEVANAWPPFVSNRSLALCCQAALKQLTGEKDIATRQEWQNWWATVDRKKLPADYVRLSELLYAHWY